jgi:pyruvate ferredoxin oxidoreductase gamma subunit
MLEVIWHGRGGQGAFTAARLLGAVASFNEGLYSLAFPSFGPERRGAPMRAFTKADTSPIGDRSETKKAECVVYLDDTLFLESWEDELKPDGFVLLNTKQDFDDEKVTCIDASGIAEGILGRDIPNTVFVSLICEISDILSLNSAKRAIEGYMPEKLVKNNLKIVDYIADSKTAGEHSSRKKRASHSQNSPTYSLKANIDRPNCIIPKLSSHVPQPEEFSHNTCWQAGFLKTKNSGWRTYRPVVDHTKCTGCLKCYMDCPDGCIFKIENRKVAVDYDFCKGCAICASSCKFDAIQLISEG